MPKLGNPISLPQDTSPDTGGSDQQEGTGTVQHIRALAMPFTRGQMITETDGSLLIKDVPMLAEGVWTDSAVGTPLNYIPKTLEEYAGNWIDTSGWSRHLGGVPRDSTDKVGEAVNPHYGAFSGNDGQQHQAVISDVRIHPFTQKSRDMQEMIRHGLISFVSVEHGGDERFNPATRQMEASSLTFTGFAFVNKGACKLCRLNEAPTEAKELDSSGCSIAISDVYPGKTWDSLTDAQKGHLRSCFAFVNGDTFADCHLPYKDPKTGAVKLDCVRNALARLNQVQGIGDKADSVRAKLQKLLQKENEENMAETKELEDKIATLTKELEAVKAQKPTEVKVEVPKELTEAVGVIKELSARLEKLEKAPAEPKTSGKTERELGTVELYVTHDKAAGTLRQE